MASFKLKADLPQRTQAEIDRILDIPSGQRLASETAFLAALEPYLYNEVILRDAEGLIVMAAGRELPTGDTGFKKGAIFIKKNASSDGHFKNYGDEDGALWEDAQPSFSPSSSMSPSASISPSSSESPSPSPSSSASPSSSVSRSPSPSSSASASVSPSSSLSPSSSASASPSPSASVSPSSSVSPSASVSPSSSASNSPSPSSSASPSEEG